MLQEKVQEILDSGYTQDEIAKFAGVSQAVISEIFTGKTKNPRMKTADGIRAMHKMTLGKRRKAWSARPSGKKGSLPVLGAST